MLDEKVPLDSIHPVYIFHKMAKEELKWIGDSPVKPSEQAKKKYLPYSNYTGLAWLTLGRAMQQSGDSILARQSLNPPGDRKND